MTSVQTVIAYYDNLVNKIDIIAEKKLSEKLDDTKKNEINSTRSLFLDKIKEIRDLNIEYLKSNKIDGQSANVFKPKVCFSINQFFDDLLGNLVIARDLVNNPVLEILNYRSSKDFESNKDYLTSQILRKVLDKYEDDLIIDISSIEKIKMEKFDIEFSDDFEIEDLEIIENMVDLDHLKTLTISVEYEFIFENGMFSKFTNLTTLKIFMLFDCFIEPECFKSLTNLKELRIGSSRRKAVFEQEILKPLIQLDKLELEAMQTTKPIESGQLLNIKNLVINECDFGFKASEVENTSLKTLLSCQDSFLNLIDPDFFKSFKSLLYLNLSGTLLGSFTTESFNYLENLEYLNLLKVEKCANSDIVYSDLNLLKLKYLAFDSRTTPEFKHLQLEFLKIRCLRKFDSVNLRNQMTLLGLSLAVNDKVYSKFNENDFNQLKKLAHLEIEITSSRKVDREKCVGFIKYKDVCLTQHRFNSDAFMASVCKYYEEIPEYMHFSNETFEYIWERFKIGYEF